MATKLNLQSLKGMAKPSIKGSATPQERAKLIHETVAFYGKDPENRRSVTPNGKCVYRSRDGRACAIGRLLKKGEVAPAWDADAEDEDGDGGPSAVALVRAGLLPQRVARFGSDFLDDLQNLHDKQEFWNVDKGGLSRWGRREVERMLELWGPKQ